MKISEVDLLPDIDRDSTLGQPIDQNVESWAKENPSYKFKGPYTINSQYDLYLAAYYETIILFAVNKADKTIHVSLETEGDLKTKTFEIERLAASGKSKLPAHLFYEYLIVKLGAVLHSMAQSQGGKAVWKRLANLPTVNVHGWDFERDEAVNLDANLDPDYDDEVWSNRDDGTEPNDINDRIYIRRKIGLVAHRK